MKSVVPIGKLAMTTAHTTVRLHWEIGGITGGHARLHANVGVVAGMTVADTIHVEFKTSCLPCAGCNVWCGVVEQYVALYL
jgi:hypothetical protein